MLPDDEPSFAGSRPRGGDVEIGSANGSGSNGGATSGNGVDDELVQQLAREERWEELVAVLIERAETGATATARAHALVRAAMIFEAKLEDPEKAFLILQTAFQEDLGNEEAMVELARLTTNLDRWPGLIADLRALLPQLGDDGQRVALLSALARFQDRHLQDLAAAEQSLTAALELAPADPAVLGALAELAGRAGDSGRAADYLARAADASGDPMQQARLHLEVAGLHRTRLGNRDRAAEHYRRALLADPGNTGAIAALGEITREAEEPPAVVPLLHDVMARPQASAPAMAPAAAAVAAPAVMAAPPAPYAAPVAYAPPPGSAEDARRLLAEGRDLEATGDLAGARERYRRAQELDPDSVPVLSAWANLAFEQESWEEARDLLERLLARPEVDLTAAEKTDLVEKLGRACLALDDAAAAAGVLAQGLAITPEHIGCREAIIEAYTKLGDASAVAHHERAAVDMLSSPEEKFDRLAQLGRHLRDEVKDPTAALKAFVDALELRPEDHRVLDETLELLTAGKMWKRAVPVLEAMANLETGTTRAKYLVAAGNILNYELHAADEAVEMYNRALDEDPDDLKTFERIDKILTAKRAWRDEARNYRKMIKRLGASPPPEKRGTALLLWKGLGEIYRSREPDLPAAAAAYEVCASLEPDDLGNQEILAEIFERQGGPGTAQAAEKRALLLERAATPEEMTKQLRALLHMYADRRLADRVWCVCAALVAFGVASPQERAAYERYAGRAFARPRAGLSEELWQRALYHPRQDRRISQVFAAVSPSVALVRAKDARSWGLDEKRRVDPASDPSLVARLVAYAGGVLGLALPALHVHPEVPGDLDLANVIDHGHLIPSFVVGSDLLRGGRPDRDVAFTIGKKMALLRLDHFLLWPNVVASMAELRVLLYAVLKFFQPSLDAPDQDQPAFKQYSTLLQRRLPAQMLEPMMAILPPLLEQGRNIDLAEWATAVDHTANRAGLVVCGDLLVALQRIAEDARAAGIAPDDAIRSLALWSVSPEHFLLREQLGLAIDG